MSRGKGVLDRRNRMCLKEWGVIRVKDLLGGEIENDFVEERS